VSQDVLGELKTLANIIQSSVDKIEEVLSANAFVLFFFFFFFFLEGAIISGSRYYYLSRYPRDKVLSSGRFTISPT
jgi:hypothetical protein